MQYNKNSSNTKTKNTSNKKAFLAREGMLKLINLLRLVTMSLLTATSATPLQQLLCLCYRAYRLLGQELVLR
jgi:hypothetical protein